MAHADLYYEGSSTNNVLNTMFQTWVASLFGSRQAGYISLAGTPYRARFRHGRLVDSDAATANAYGLMAAHFDQIGF